MKANKILLGVIVILAATAQAVFAQYYREGEVRIGPQEIQGRKGIHIGPASLKTLLAQQVVYDSNVFLTSNSRKHDLISITSPTFLLDVPLGTEERHLFQLLYTVDAAAFSNYKDQNYTNQDAAANLNLSLPFGYINAQNDFKDTVDRSATEFTEQVRRRENMSQVTFGAELNKLSGEIGAAHFLKKYTESDLNSFDYTEDIYTAMAFYQLLPKTKALLEYNHGVVEYTKTAGRGGDYDQALAGFKGELTGKTTGIIKLGYQDRSYDNPARKGFQGFVSETGINTRFSERTSLDLKYISTAVESTYLDNSYYDLNSVALNLTQKFMGDYTLTASSQYDRRRYPESDSTKRRDSLLTESLSLAYDLKDGAKVSVSYRYLEDISNIDSLDYSDNLISLRFDFQI